MKRIVSGNQLLKGFMRATQGRVTVLFILFSCLVSSSSAVSSEFSSIVDIGLFGDMYLTESSDNNGQGYVNLLIQNTSANYQLWLDLGAGGLVGESPHSFFKAPQFYFRLGQQDKVHLILGRVKQNWSHGDEFWQLGMTQPLFEWDATRPEAMGLTGLFIGGPLTQKWQWKIFGSPLFIPGQGPTFSLSDGELTSSNPWFRPPPGEVLLDGVPRRVNYTLSIPDTQDIVSQVSFGALVGSQRDKKGFIGKVFYLNKPKNTFMLPFSADLNGTSQVFDAVVQPTVARHDLYGVEVGWNQGRTQSLLSWLHETSSRYTPPNLTYFPVMPSQDILSVTQLFRLGQSQRLWLGYMKSFGGGVEVESYESELAVSAFSLRNRFVEAAKVRWESSFSVREKGNQIRPAIEVNRSMITDNTWLAVSIDWAFAKGFEAIARCDFFGGSEKVITARDFMSAYQNNDRCLVGGHYAF